MLSTAATGTFRVELHTGVTVSVNLDGAGPNLLMLGGPHTAELMRGFVGPHFTRAGFRLVTVEYRGVPPSDSPPGEYTVAQLTADLIAVLEHCGLAPCHAFGYSLGASVVQELLVDRPDLVSRAVLAGTYASQSLASIEMHEEFLEREHAGRSLPAATETVLRAQMMFGPRRLASDVFVKTVAQVLGLPPTEGYNSTGLTAASLHHTPRPDRLASITVPCRVIGLEHDLLTPVDRAREVARLIPGAEYHEIRRCGHGAFIEQPRELTRLVIEFLQAGSGSASSIVDTS